MKALVSRSPGGCFYLLFFKQHSQEVGLSIQREICSHTQVTPKTRVPLEKPLKPLYQGGHLGRGATSWAGGREITSVS